ncbi:hypothetical protein DRN58_06375 [Thermococci archaeon]|nr:MAG: hypothetical protein DRN58_06375 [Thermococci archaeon]
MKKIILLTLAIIGVGVSIYLIHGYINKNTPTPEPTLPGEEGTTFSGENLLKGIRIQQIGWNGEYWLIVCENLSEGSFHLVSFDGNTFKDITPQELKNMSDIHISSISTEGKIWILKEATQCENCPRNVYRFDGKNVEMEKEEVDSESYWEVPSCNDKYCLTWDKKSKKLMKTYDDHTVDLTEEFEKKAGISATFPGLSVGPIVWNGEYWLIELSTKAGGMLVKYDGESFEFLLSKVRRFKWNEEYWLITLMDIKEGGAVKYDGESFEYISIPSSYGAGALEWNGEYWLIGTVNSPFGGSNGLVRYDGSTVVDLSKEFQNSILRENKN